MRSPQKLYIRGLSVLSAIGSSVDDWQRSLNAKVSSASCLDGDLASPVFTLTNSSLDRVRAIRAESRYSKLDSVALYAVAASRQALLSLEDHSLIGCISIGSSRGVATALEKTLCVFQETGGSVPVITSPITTAGNLSSWVSQECCAASSNRSDKPVALMTTSMTCTSAFHSLLVARSFLLSGMASVALFGGSEACLTKYTIAQLRALGIYSAGGAEWPSRPLFMPSQSRTNAVVLGEGAGAAMLVGEDLLDNSTSKVDDLELLGVGWAVEEIHSATGMSKDGVAFEAAMRMAIKDAGSAVCVDAVIAHAPGSILGDGAEVDAIVRVLGRVSICTTKHVTGHTYGASGMISLSLAQALLKGMKWPGMPYPASLSCGSFDERPRVIMINTAGFGGNSISIIVSSTQQD